MTEKLEPLFEQLEKDQKAANLNDQGEPANDKSSEGTDAGDRIATRRNARKPASTPQDKSGTSQKDVGAPRGSGGEPQADGEGAQGDASAPSGNVDAPRTGAGSDGEPVLEDKPLSPKEEAYHRRKQRESDARIKELETKIAELSKPASVAEPAKTEPVKSNKSESFDEWRARNPEPDKEQDLAGWLVWNAEDNRKWREEQTQATNKTQEERRVESLVQSAKQEIEQIQGDYKKKNPDYDNAFNHAKQEYSKAIKVLMPQMTEAQVQQAIDKEVFNLALQCNKNGTNLGEVLYDMAIERFGYEPGSTVSVSKIDRPNLRVVANNKRKSASPLNSGGEGAKPRITVEQAADMSPEEMLNLDASDWEYLRSQGLA